VLEEKGGKKVLINLKKMDKNTEIEYLKKALKREKLARREAGFFMESKGLELYETNQKLTDLIANINKFPEENPNPVMRFSSHGQVLMFTNNAGKIIISFLDEEKNYKALLFFTEQLKYSFKEGVNHKFELNLGSAIFMINAVPFTSNNYINIYANDISAIKKASEAIKQSEEKYRGIIENLKLGILEVDNNDKIIKAYPQFCSLVGYEEDELIGESPTFLFLDESSRKIMAEQNEERLKGVSSVYEVPLIKKNGEIAWVIISGAPFYSNQGKLTGSIGIHLDITERRKMESALRESKFKAEELNKVKELFLANMSHEIRTPMNAIVGMSELLEQTGLDNSQTKYLSAINSSSKNLLVLINDLLDFSKIESGNLSLELVDFNLRKLIAKSTEIVGLKAEENGVNVIYKVDDNLPEILNGDPTRLGQVLLNLLSNAVKFTTNGLVLVSVNLVKIKGDKCLVEFIVKDEGIGIPESELINIFKDFTQAKKSTTRLYGGTGLGLSISQNILKLMNGTLEVRSELNKGSEFFFTIELEEAKNETSEKENNENYKIEKDFKQSFILLVEDNPLNSLMATTILEKWNCIIDLAENGVEAIEKLRAKTYDLILMDMTMPKMGGIEASQIIRDELKVETPIIALTANAISGDSKKCLEAGMNDYLSKPYSQIDLNRVLTKWVNPEASEILYDLSKLEEMGDPVFLEKMLKLFLVETDKAVTIISKALEESDFKQISLVAHKIKPSLNYVCIPRLFDAVITIEIWQEADDVLIDRTKLFLKDLQLVLEQLKQVK
jgi:PAS domain S-box-containing protein